MVTETDFQSEPANTKEALNNSPLNSQSMKNEQYDFRFSLKINNFSSSILVTHPCAAGISELISGSLTLVSNIGLFELYLT